MGCCFSSEARVVAPEQERLFQPDENGESNLNHRHSAFSLLSKEPEDGSFFFFLSLSSFFFFLRPRERWIRWGNDYDKESPYNCISKQNSTDGHSFSTVPNRRESLSFEE